MAFLGSEALKERLVGRITDFNVDRIKGAAYELSLGDHYYTTDSKNRKRKYFKRDNSQIRISPGQFALLITKEEITVPSDLIGFISLKFGQKIKGLVNVSGFHVDPSFEGKIIFSVYNAGSKSIYLQQGAPYFQIWFANLEDHNLEYRGIHHGQTEIGNEQIERLSGDIASPNVLKAQIDQLKSNQRIIISIASVLVTAAITVTLKSKFDLNSYEHGYIKGRQEKRIDEYVYDKVESLDLDSALRSTIERKNSFYNYLDSCISNRSCP